VIHSPRFNPKVESLRGLAALSVCFTHSLAIYQIDHNVGIWNVPIWHQSPWAACLDLINAIFNPHAAVILFFILSGYVLTQSLGIDRAPTTKSVTGFYIRRFLRIVPMMWAALFFTYALSKVNHSVSDSLVSVFYVNTFEYPIHLMDVLRNCLLVDFKASPVTWTMRIELLGSLLMPVIVWFVVRAAPWQKLVALAALFAVAYFTHNDFQYMVCFYVGALLTDKGVVNAFARGPGLAICAGLVICAALRLTIFMINHPTLSNVVGTIGAALVLVGVLAAPARFGFLEGGPCRIVGRLSYSLYLLHPPVLGICAVAAFALNLYPTLSGATANLIIFFVSVALTLACAAITYQYIESPCMALGKRLTKPASARV
jgi:peptidoglycan/LPS O-acetylase OafA/YrhL